jgi:hypothetical protein
LYRQKFYNDTAEETQWWGTPNHTEPQPHPLANFSNLKNSMHNTSLLPLKEKKGLFAFGFYFGLWLWAFWCGKLLEGKRITEEKRIARGKLLNGKGWLKRG